MSRVYTASHVNAPFNYVTVAASASVNNLAAFTYAAWIYPTEYPEIANPIFNYANITSKNYNVAEIDMAFSSLNGTPVGYYGFRTLTSIGFGPDAIAYSAAVDNAIVLNQWQRCVMTFDYNGDKKFHLYINGAEVTYQQQVALTGGPFDDSGGPITIGDISPSATGANPFTGNISQFELWNAALTPVQVAADYAGSDVLPLNVVSHLTFLTDQGGTEPDTSGHSNVGIITGATFSSSNPPTPATVYSVPDCRNYGNFPNDSRDVNGTLTYDVPSVDSRAAGAPVDSRTAGAPVSSGTYPQNSRTPGTYGPGE